MRIAALFACALFCTLLAAGIIGRGGGGREQRSYFSQLLDPSKEMKSSIAPGLEAALKKRHEAAAAAAAAAAAEEECKIVVFRHLPKTGGSAVREYFERHYKIFGIPRENYIDPDTGELAVGLDATPTVVIKKLLDMARNTGKAPKTKLFIELHTSLTVIPKLMVLFDYLDELKTFNCHVLTFVILREPLELAISNFHFFPTTFKEYGTNLTSFLYNMPEFFLWAACLYKIDDAPDPTTYPQDRPLQDQFYSEITQFLNRFDMVGTIDLFEYVWQFVCEYMDLNRYPMDRCPSDETLPCKCEYLSRRKVNINHVTTSHKMSDEYASNLALGKRNNPVSFRVWGEYHHKFQGIVSRYNQSSYRKA